MEFEQLLQLIDAVSKSALNEFKYEEKGISIKMGKGVADVQAEGAPAVEFIAPKKSEKKEVVKEESVIEGGNVVISPLVGTFYTAAAEGAENFVQVGDKVKKGQVLAIVEAMKLMNEIESEYDGVIVEVLAENGDAVEYGQPLFRIK